MLHDNMNISHLMVYARKFEEARAKRKSRDAKRARSFDGGSSKNTLEIQEKPKFKKRFSNQVPSEFQELVVIGCLTLNSRREKVLIHKMRSQLVENVVKSTMLISLRGRIFSLVIERVVTR